MLSVQQNPGDRRGAGTPVHYPLVWWCIARVARGRAVIGHGERDVKAHRFSNDSVIAARYRRKMVTRGAKTVSAPLVTMFHAEFAVEGFRGIVPGSSKREQRR